MQNEEKQTTDFEVQCNVCSKRYENWTGSTPCCGSIAYLVENGEVTSKISLFASFGGSPIEPTVIELPDNKKP